MVNSVIQIENVSKHYGNLLALKNISLTIQEGEIIGLVGPNGAGKTTTLKLIAGLIHQDKGKILIKNKQGNLQNIIENSNNLVEMGFLIDIPHFPNTTPYRLLTYIAKIRNYPKNEINDRINYLLTQFELIDRKYRKIKTFSKGMVQKLGFIVAIINNPEIIILDEPQTGLDPLARIKVRDSIKSLQKEGKTIFVSSHMLFEIGEICNKLALINHGTIIAYDTLENLSEGLINKELVFNIIDEIQPNRVESLIKKMNDCLEPYLEKNLEAINSKEKIIYDSKKKQFTIYFDGNKTSKGEILNLLVDEFKSEFIIEAFSESKTSQLERLYLKMINANESLK